jgi:hypothetical protein
MTRRAYGLILLLAPLVALAGLYAGPALAKSKAKPKERYYLSVVAIEADPGLDVKKLEPIVKAKLESQLKNRPEFLLTLPAGGPDPKADPVAWDKWASKKKLRAYEVRIKFMKYERTVAPIQGSTDQLFTVHVELQLLGSLMPLGTVGMTGSGSGTVSTQVGKKITDNIDADVHAQAIDGALAQSLDEAVRQLRAHKPKTK